MITSIGCPPPTSAAYDVFYWERSNDPWHKDAFPEGVLKDPDNLLILGGGELKEGERKEGWMAYDSARNPAGFFPDGTEFTDKEKYIMGFSSFDRLCAIPEYGNCYTDFERTEAKK